MTEAPQEQGKSLLEEALLANRPKLVAFLRHAGAGDHAEDLLQEAWLRLQGAAATPIADPLPYLYRVLHNLLLDRRRGEARARRRDESWSDATGSTMAGISEEPAGDRVLMARQQLEAVEKRLEALGEPTAGIFRRHRVGGATQREIAADLGMGLSTVEKHLRKAYRAMLELAESFDEA